MDRLAGMLADEILGGRLAPGAHLREEEFAERYDVSRNTLREAVHRLAGEGLVVHRPHRGIVVTRPSREAVMEIFRIRRILEAAALVEIDPDSVNDLLRLAVEMEAAASDDDWTRLVSVDLAWHARLVASLSSTRLDDFFATILRELRLSFVLIDSSGASTAPPSHVPDHRTIAENLRRDSTDAARTRLLEHLNSAERQVLEHLEAAALAGDRA